jgi:molecular chaperone GrpE
MKEKRSVLSNGDSIQPGSEQKEQAAEFRVIDKRHFADVDSISGEAAVEEKRRYPAFVEELMARLAETERRFEEKKKQVDDEIAKIRSRLQADYERRIQLQKSDLLLPFLEVLDNLERALDAAQKTDGTERLLEGIVMTASLFRSKLQALGVEAIPVLNQPFDPNLGEAVGIVEVADQAEDGLVIEEVRRGYRMGEQLVRPAQVRIGKLRQL